MRLLQIIYLLCAWNVLLGSGILTETALNSSLKHVIVWLKSRRGHNYLKVVFLIFCVFQSDKQIQNPHQKLGEQFPKTLSVTHSRFRDETTKTLESLQGQGWLKNLFSIIKFMSPNIL